MNPVSHLIPGIRSFRPFLPAEEFKNSKQVCAFMSRLVSKLIASGTRLPELPTPAKFPLPRPFCCALDLGQQWSHLPASMLPANLFDPGGHMRRILVPGFVLLAFISVVSAQSTKQSKKSDAPAMLTSAQSVFVEPYLGPAADGSIYDAKVTPEDRDAVTNVLDSLQKWGYYKIAIRRNQADLVIFVRTGRASHSYSGVHVQTGRTDPNAPSPPGTGVGGREGVEAGSDEDMFWVYWRTGDRLNGPIWQQNLKDGLDAPTLVLFQNFKDAVTTLLAQQAKKKASNSTP
jgi:hypothetical protein